MARGEFLCMRPEVRLRAIRWAAILLLVASAVTAMPAWSREVTLELDGKLYSFDPNRDYAREGEALRALLALPADQDDVVIDMLLRNAADVTPPFLYELARRLWVRDRDLAFEWYAVAFIRGAYDGDRCVDRSARQGLNYFREIARNVIEGIQQDRPGFGRAGLRAFARSDVFSGTASPHWICGHGVGAYTATLDGTTQPESEWLLPEAEWAAIRARLRAEGARAFQNMVQPPAEQFPLVSTSFRRIDLGPGAYGEYAWLDAQTLAIETREDNNGQRSQRVRLWRRDGSIEEAARPRGSWCAGNGRIGYVAQLERAEGNNWRMTYRVGEPGNLSELALVLAAPIVNTPLLQSTSITGGSFGQGIRLSPFDCRWVDGEPLLGRGRLSEWLPLLPGDGVLRWGVTGIIHVPADGMTAAPLRIAPGGLPADGVRYYAFRGGYFLSPLGLQPRRGTSAAACNTMWWLFPRDARVEETCVPRDSVDADSPVVMYAPSRIGMLRLTPIRRTSQGDRPGGLYLTDANGRTQKIVESSLNSMSLSPDGCAIAFRYWNNASENLSVIELCSQASP